MGLITRRIMLAAGATLPAALGAGKSLAAGRVAVPRAEDLSPPGAEVPAIDFVTADGEQRTLRDYLGRGVVLNFWATWCIPCVAEMPALAKLAALTTGGRVAILPLSSDRGGGPAVQHFFREKNISGLPVLLDPHGTASHTFGVRGIPTTVLIDAQGRERGRLEGAADWADPSAVAAVKALAG